MGGKKILSLSGPTNKAIRFKYSDLHGRGMGLPSQGVAVDI